MVRSLSSHAYMLGFMFFHVYVLSFYMSTCMFLCLYVQIYVFTCLCAWIYILYMLYAIFHVLVHSMPCLCAQTQAMFVMPCAIVALSSLCLSFLYFGLSVRTQSRPSILCHCPYSLAHIKGFGSFLFACFCLLASMSIMLIYFMPLSCTLCIFSFHCLSAGFLSLPLHVHTQSEDAWSQGTVFQVQAKRARMQACRYKPSGNVQQIQGSSLSHLVMYSFNPLSFLLPFLLNVLYQVYHAVYQSSSLEYGDPYLLSCTYILGHALGIQAFTFPLCVLVLCMMYVCIYIYIYIHARPLPV